MTAIIATEDFYTLDEHDILADPQTGLPGFSWSGQATVRNKLDIFYDFNDPALRKDDFGRRQVWTADASVTRYLAQPAVRMEFAGVRTNRGGQALMDTLALGFLQRWGQAPWLLRLAVTFRRHPLEILDSVRVSHPLITNPITGRRGLVRETFEILEVTPQWLTEGKLQLLLLWTGAIETSAAPVSTGGLSLVPGLGTTDDTDMPVPLAGAVTITTAAGTRALTIGLKATAYRNWRCTFDGQVFIPGDGTKGNPGGCVASQADVSRSYTSQVTYSIQYKTDGAPDAPGTGSDPTTGWVTLRASTPRGAVSMFNEQACSAAAPVTPAEDLWIEHFDVLGGGPATYNLKVFFESIAAQAEPCSTMNPNICSGTCGGGVLVDSVQTAEADDFSVDYVTSIT